jgi:hypothetical protein
MNFNLVEMYNGLLRFNKHILNELAEGLKHLPNLDGVSKGDSLIINEQGNPAWGSTAFIPTFENAAYNSVYLLKKGVNHSDVTIDNIQDKCYFIGDQANTNSYITEFDFRFGPYFVPNKVGTNKKTDYNEIKGNNGQDTDKAVRVLLLDGCASDDSRAGSGYFTSAWVRSTYGALVGFFTTVKLD